MNKNKITKIFSIIFVLLVLITLVSCKKDKNDVDRTLPKIEGLTETEIREEFKNRNIVVSIDFKEYYIKNDTDNKGVKYGEGFEVGDEVANGSIVTIYLSSNSITLPSLNGMTREEISAFFANIGVTSVNLTLRPDVNMNVPTGTFIAYENSSVGQKYDFKTKLVVLYDTTKEFEDLSGLNKYEIIKHFEQFNSIVNFTYEVDNSKEFDTFKKYLDFEPGDRFIAGDQVEIVLYSNDNINVGETIVNESQLIISKYIDGLGNNRAIELYNPTNSAIDLSNYYIAILENASLKPTSEITLTGTLESHATYVVVKEGAEAALINKADLVTPKITFDGNDAIQLRQTSNHTYIDQIYHPGNISLTMDEEVFVRKAGVTTGNRTFVQREWIGFIPTYLTPVGEHPWLETEDLNPAFAPSNITYSNGGLTKIQFTSAADGDTIYGNSLDPNDPVSFQGDGRVRFLMVDTPETSKPGVTGEPYANVAHDFSRTLLQNAVNVYIQADLSVGITDTYGRHLGLVWFEIAEDIQFTNITKDGSPITIEKGHHLLNFLLIKYGLGEKNIAKTAKYNESPIFNNRYLYQWGDEALHYAITNQLGLYSGVHRN